MPVKGDASSRATSAIAVLYDLASNAPDWILGKLYDVASDLPIAKELTPRARELYRHAYEGEGKPLSYEANSEMSSLITNGQSLQNQIKVIGNKIPLGETQVHAISIGPEEGDAADFHMGPGKGSLNLKITRISENRVHVEGVYQDYYNFDYWGEQPPKSWINDGAHRLQKAGILTPYEWDSNIDIDITSKESE